MIQARVRRRGFAVVGPAMSFCSLLSDPPRRSGAVLGWSGVWRASTVQWVCSALSRFLAIRMSYQRSCVGQGWRESSRRQRSL